MWSDRGVTPCEGGKASLTIDTPSDLKRHIEKHTVSLICHVFTYICKIRTTQLNSGLKFHYIQQVFKSAQCYMAKLTLCISTVCLALCA